MTALLAPPATPLPSPPAPPVLRLCAVTKHFRRGDETVKALDGVSLSVAAGEFVSVVGRSGSGKSTLLHLAGGFTRPEQGSVLVGETDLRTCTDRRMARLRRRTVGFVFQFFHLLPTLTVYENVALPLVADGRRGIQPRVDAQLERLGLAHRRDHHPGQLSGGEMQRTAIARALVPEPAVVIADEPTGNLDSTTGHRVIELLTAAVRDADVALLLVTHDARIAGLADRVVRLRDGQLSE